MQCERQEDLYQEENSSSERSSHQQWQVKHKNKGPSADINMVFMLPMEFLALSDNEEEVVLSDQVAQLTLDLIVDTGSTGYPAREREDLVQLGFFPCKS